MMRRCIALIALALFWLGPAASSREAPPANADAVLKRFFHEVRQLQADFTQLEFDGDGVFRKESIGRLYLSRPGRFRLDYLEPDELLIWANGETLSIFDKELEQVTVYRQAGQLRESAAALLAGDASALESYEVKAAEFEDGLQWFNLASADTEQGSLRLALRGSVPAALEYSDELGSRVRLLLSRLDGDSELDGKLFDPDIPAGVDIFEAAES
ncbi:MAG: outer-membrane lipoprotein carrier protein LolA [Gammaproteobacteria bacterium]|nr:outer-membrane lipoprotein carrier protein LolA [Gammaproteobacteria bacterium]